MVIPDLLEVSVPPILLPISHLHHPPFSPSSSPSPSPPSRNGSEAYPAYPPLTRLFSATLTSVRISSTSASVPYHAISSELTDSLIDAGMEEVGRTFRDVIEFGTDIA